MFKNFQLERGTNLCLGLGQISVNYGVAILNFGATELYHFWNLNFYMMFCFVNFVQQYSSGLVQYWGTTLHSEYGGFKPDHIQKELKRAGSLVSFILRSSK